MPAPSSWSRGCDGPACQERLDSLPEPDGQQATDAARAEDRDRGHDLTPGASGKISLTPAAAVKIRALMEEDADVSVLSQQSGRFVLRDNEKTEVIAERLLQPAFCLRAGTRYDAVAPILPQAVAA